MNEHELGSELRTAAEEVHGRSDLADVEQRAGKARNRRRVTGGVLAAMLVAAAGGVGFGIGRSVADDQGEISLGDTDVLTDTSDATTTDTDDVAVVPPAAPAEEPAAEPAIAPSATVPARGSVTVAADASTSFGTEYDGDVWVQPVLDVIYERTLPDGVRVRFQRGEPYPQEYVDGQWQPAGFCWPTTDGRMTIDGPDVVDVGWYGWYTDLFDDVQIERADLGAADGHPLRVLQVQARDTVTEVAVTWDDGATDRTPIVNGVAALVVEGQGAWDLAFSIEVVTADGSSTLTSGDLDHWSDPDYVASCQEPPPGLPEAGEQPADPDAAIAALSARFDLLWNMDVPRDDKLDLLDDWTGVAEAIDAVQSGGFAATAATAVHQIDEVVFTSPTDAWFFYSILTDVSNFRDRYGQAALVDGVWQFPRALICQDLGLAGGGCEPWADGIYPPSYYERYGEPGCYDTEDGVVCEDFAAYDESGNPIPATLPAVAPEG